ncbi:MAG: type VI secretion system accessory protein TagJ [Rhodospirillales bacterium]
MDSLSLLRAGDPQGALEQLKGEVRRAPRDARLRTFLFQLFCVTGAWERALIQLAAAGEMDPAAIPMAQTYRTLIRCEVLRERIFAGQRTPTIFGDPAPWMSLQIEALRLLAAGKPDEAAALRDQAFEAAPATPGTLNGEPFEWIADADPRLGPILEAVVEGRYVWVPFHQVRKIEQEMPTDLRDQVWMPANFVWANGGDGVGFIPARYPGSQNGEAALALGRRTEWQEQDGWALGLGQRMLATDAGETALLDVRTLVLHEAA